MAIKIRPDLVYAVFCLRKPPSASMIPRIASELVAKTLPYHRTLWLVVGWQRGYGIFDFTYILRSEDGEEVAQGGPVKVGMYPQGTRIFDAQVEFTCDSYGIFLLEGFLDGEQSFRTMLKVSKPETTTQ